MKEFGSRLFIGLSGASLVLISSLAIVAASVPPTAIAVTGAGQPSPATAMRPCYRDVENGGLPITRFGGVFTYGAAANRQWARSENIWSTPSGCVNLMMGHRVTYSFDIKPQFGSTGPSVWHVVSQLHGPTTNGTWPGPPVALVVESGQWRLSGGYAVPNGRGGFRRDLGYTKHLSRVKAGAWQHWTFDVVLGGPRNGSVSVWLDGTKVVAAFKPAGGTMYTVGRGYSHAYLQLKTGQYTGADNSADTPTWRRTVQVKNVKFAIR